MTNPSHFAAPRTLRPHDPSELLAEAQVCRRAPVEDCMVLLGHAHRTASVLTITVPARDLLTAMRPQELLDMHMDILRSYGATGAFAAVVIGDPYLGMDCRCPEGQPNEGCPHATVREGGVRLAGLLLAIARQQGPDPFDVPEAWVCSAGIGVPVRLSEEAFADPSDLDLIVGPEQRLAPIESTLVGAQAVVEGIPIPQSRAQRTERLLPLVGAIAETWADSSDRERILVDAQIASAEWSTRWARLSVRLHDVRRGSAAAPADRCEAVQEVLAALVLLADVLAFEQLLDLLITTGNRFDVRREERIVALTADASLAPDHRVRAGGSWYSALEDLLLIAELLEAAQDLTRTDLAAEAVLDDAATHLHLALSVLAWWHHRFATAGEHAEAALERAPERVFAECFAEMASRPVLPAWAPSAAAGRPGA